jgi:hypothetical protein
MKVSELPDTFKELALKHQEVDGNEVDESVDLVNAFDWKTSPEGGEFWWDVYNEKYHDAITKNKSEQPMAMITYGADWSRFTTPKEDLVASYKNGSDFAALITLLMNYEGSGNFLIHSYSTPEVVERRKEMFNKKNNLLNGRND